MFKRFGNVFGSRKKTKTAKSGKADGSPRTPPGEGIRLLAAALPHSDDPVPARPAAARTPASPPAPPPQAEPTPAPAPDPAAREDLIREALRIRRNKAKDLNDLPARDRKRLRQLAEKMMGVGPEEPAAPTNGAGPDRKRGPSGTRH